MSNLEIAAQRHISHRTAAHHGAAILAKLLVGNRRDAARALRDLGLAGAPVAGAAENI